MSPVDWLGNRVDLQSVEGTELTLVQWCRPWNGSLGGARFLGAEEFAHVRNAVDEAAGGDRKHPQLDGAGRPADLERFLEELLGR